MPVPLLSTGIVGLAGGEKLLGPGHASFLRDAAGDWRAVWHASTSAGAGHPSQATRGSASSCVRFPFISDLVFGDDGWPYVDL